MKRVAVIGAGAAGVCAARHLSVTKNLKFDVFEKANGIGGVWKYTDRTGLDEHGLKVHSAMYKSLRTNLPKETIAFPDLPFDQGFPTYITHQQVLDYLTKYANHFNILNNIQFETVVTNVQVIKNDNCTATESWKIDYNDLKTQTSHSKIYDAVFVCNGHYAEANYPKFPNEKFFKGNIIHSHSYRSNESYVDKNVVIVGGRASGIDIGIDVSKVAKHIRISHRTVRLPDPLPSNLSQSLPISQFNEDGETIEFLDGSSMKVDCVIYCTGYLYDFPFLNENCDIKIHDNRVTWLYNHIINVQHPSMCFIGICLRNAPLPQFHCQVQYAIAVMFGNLTLPSETEMISEIESDFEQRMKEGLKAREAHLMDERQWPYNHKLADLANVTRVPDYVQELYWLARVRRKTYICSYKNETYIKIDGKYQLE